MPKPSLIALLVALATAIALTAGPATRAQPLLDDETEQLLVDAVTAAVELDLYNARCRRDLSGRRTENLNKELVSRFRTTVIRVQDSLFPERSYRKAQERLQEEFLQRLRQAGGCKEAKTGGMADALGKRYDQLMREIEAVP